MPFNTFLVTAFLIKACNQTNKRTYVLFIYKRTHVLFVVNNYASFVIACVDLLVFDADFCCSANAIYFFGEIRLDNISAESNAARRKRSLTPCHAASAGGDSTTIRSAPAASIARNAAYRS